MNTKPSKPLFLIEALCRSQGFWLGFIVLAYFSASRWCGMNVFYEPIQVLYVAPNGLLTWLLHFHFIEPGDYPRGFNYLCHGVFWPTFIFLVWRAPVLRRSVLFPLAAILVATILTTLAGCEQMVMHGF